MNGDSILLDTNAFIYFLEGRATIADIVLLADEVCFSPITEIELLRSPHLDDEESEGVRGLLSTCQRVDLDQTVVDAAINLSRRYGLRVPDAVIAASAVTRHLTLVTADQHFSRIAELDVVSDILD